MSRWLLRRLSAAVGKWAGKLETRAFSFADPLLLTRLLSAAWWLARGTLSSRRVAAIGARSNPS